jgi:hypothetical protein
MVLSRKAHAAGRGLQTLHDPLPFDPTFTSGDAHKPISGCEALDALALI